jgi:putative peptidoglycan lipid II flippase
MALATSIAGWVNLALMMMILHKRGVFAPDTLLKARLTKLAVSSVIMALALWAVGGYFRGYYEEHAMMKVVALTSVITLGVCVYSIGVIAMGAYDTEMMKRLVRRKR